MTSRDRASSKRESSNSATGFVNAFQNDGSFLEMFKKMQNAASRSETDGVKAVATAVEPSKEVGAPEKKEVSQPALSASASSKPTPPNAFFGRRRCSKPLPVGKVKKLKADDEEKKPASTDAWAKYLEEVKKYKETYCDSEAKNRSLVK